MTRTSFVKMRLLTNNMLSLNIKSVTNGFPLRVEAEKVVEKPVEMNHDFLKNMFTKVDWKAFVDASRSMGYADLPEEAEASMLEFAEFLNKFHHALLELHLEERALVCPETGRKFPVHKVMRELAFGRGRVAHELEKDDMKGKSWGRKGPRRAARRRKGIS